MSDKKKDNLGKGPSEEQPVDEPQAVVIVEVPGTTLVDKLRTVQRIVVRKKTRVDPIEKEDLPTIVAEELEQQLGNAARSSENLDGFLPYLKSLDLHVRFVMLAFIATFQHRFTDEVLEKILHEITTQADTHYNETDKTIAQLALNLRQNELVDSLEDAFLQLLHEEENEKTKVALVHLMTVELFHRLKIIDGFEEDRDVALSAFEESVNKVVAGVMDLSSHHAEITLQSRFRPFVNKRAFFLEKMVDIFKQTDSVITSAQVVKSVNFIINQWSQQRTEAGITITYQGQPITIPTAEHISVLEKFVAAMNARVGSSPANTASDSERLLVAHLEIGTKVIAEIVSLAKRGLVQ